MVNILNPRTSLLEVVLIVLILYYVYLGCTVIKLYKKWLLCAKVEHFQVYLVQLKYMSVYVLTKIPDRMTNKIKSLIN